jgi:DNA-binding transcriptional LysR family regulator
MLAFVMAEGSILRFDLTDLRLFLTVAEQGSLTRGARTMNLALASASARVSRMEAAFGAPLLERTRRGVRTTAAGEALILHARLILGQVEQMRGDLRQFATGLKGRIRLLSNTAALASVLPQQLCRFLSAYPDLSVDLHERPSAEIALALAEGRADLGIVADITDLAALQTHLLAEDQLVVLACATHPIAGREAVAFMDVVDEPFVGFSDTALEIHLAERAARLGRRLHYRVQLRTIEQVGAMVEAGVGIAIVSQIAAAKVRSLGPAAVPLNEPWASRRLHLCASDFASLTPHARLLAAQLMEATWQ